MVAGVTKDGSEGPGIGLFFCSPVANIIQDVDGMPTGS